MRDLRCIVPKNLNSRLTVALKTPHCVRSIFRRYMKMYSPGLLSLMPRLANCSFEQRNWICKVKWKLKEVMANSNLTLVIFALLTSHAAVTANSYDYIIAGGGTSGLVLANRLSEDPAVTVAVIEPGGDVRDNTNVTDPGKFQAALGTPIDWAYPTAPQAKGANRTLTLHAGKAIGGTSTINGMMYIRADAAEIDAWETLGNPGWNWEALLPYYKRAERFTRPTPAQAIVGASYEPQYHGEDGHLHVGFSYDLPNGSFYPIARDTWGKLGYPVNDDINSGETGGFGVSPQTIDRDQDLRWDAARAYYYPVQGRPNLHIVKGTVTKILWEEEDDNENKVASGVQYVDSNGEALTATAEKEVILSAGSLRTPLILELSGVGNTKSA